jgi:hypothetical protein
MHFIIFHIVMDFFSLQNPYFHFVEHRLGNSDLDVNFFLIGRTGFKCIYFSGHGIYNPTDINLV